MAGPAGQDTVERLGSRDLNLDGEIINLAIVGSSRFYDFMVFEGAIESWVEENGYPDMIIVQEMEYESQEPLENEVLPEDYVLETLKEIQFTAKLWVRISRVVIPGPHSSK